MNNKLSEEKKNEVRELVKSGLNLSQTAKKTGVSLTSVRKIVKPKKAAKKPATSRSAKAVTKPALKLVKEEKGINLRTREGLMQLIGELTVELKALKV